MTRRTYVKPEWHAMGMPIAEAACSRGGGDVGVMYGCDTGGYATSCWKGTTASPTQTGCRTGDGNFDWCSVGNTATASCSTGTGVTGQSHTDCLSGVSAPS